MNNNNNCYILISLIFINLLICVSCNDCWKVSTGIIGFIIIFKGFVYIFYYKPTQFIYPSQELTNVYDNNNNILSITIENTPDFSRLYVKETVSPLHQPLFVCSICLDEDTENIKTLLCGHKFHKDCIEEWVNKEETCPLCRIDFNV